MSNQDHCAEDLRKLETQLAEQDAALDQFWAAFAELEEAAVAVDVGDLEALAEACVPVVRIPINPARARGLRC